jgi:GNAT superfamily N-acetyltransferase
MEKIVRLTEENLEQEHICCAISDKKCREGYAAKKEWIRSQLKDGYVFKKLDVRGKVFIEYVPAEKAWAPVEAPGYMMINCFWVSGQYKGKGHGRRLLQECLDDAKGMNGLVALTSSKKQPFLSDRMFYQKHGFTQCDSAEPYFELWHLPLKTGQAVPRFRDVAKHGTCDVKEGLALYYTNGCPFTAYYAAELEVIAAEKGFKIRTFRIDSREQAQNHFVPFTNYSVFRDGKFVTQHILNEKYFDRFIH